MIKKSAKKKDKDLERIKSGLGLRFCETGYQPKKTDGLIIPPHTGSNVKKIIKTAEYRPCIVDTGTEGRKALFHRWIDIEQPTLKINGFNISAECIKSISKTFTEKNVIPNNTEIIKTKRTFAIVEYENGKVAEVEPTKIRFADDKIKDYAF